VQAIGRRQFIGGAGTGIAAALALGGCATGGRAAIGTFNTADISEGCNLAPVKVSADRLIRTVVGLRPYRPSGFVVRGETLGDKRLVHNYGHGGAGITLCWGTSKLAVDLGLPGHAGPVAVIGAGAVGLATARLCQEAGYPVTVYARALPPETTSNIAGGQWYPSRLFRPGLVTPAFRDQFVAAARYASRRFQLLTGSRYGVRWMMNYACLDQPADTVGRGSQSAGRSSYQDVTEELIADLLPVSRTLGRGEHPFPHAHVRQYAGLIIEPSIYLRETLIDVYTAGGRVVVRDFRSLSDVAALPERVVFNCTGLGARDLVGDRELVPMRGQLSFLLPQPEVRYAVSAPGGLYMFSRADGVLLGGTGEVGDWSLAPDAATVERILAGHARLFSGFRCA
jgi:D-amino-acid oxidase